MSMTNSIMVDSFLSNFKETNQGKEFLAQCKYLEDGLLVSYGICHNISLVMIEFFLVCFWNNYFDGLVSNSLFWKGFLAAVWPVNVFIQTLSCNHYYLCDFFV